MDKTSNNTPNNQRPPVCADDTPKKLGKILRIIRKKHGVTATSLGIRCNFSYGTVCLIEREGVSNLPTYIKLINNLGYTFEEVSAMVVTLGDLL